MCTNSWLQYYNDIRQIIGWVVYYAIIIVIIILFIIIARLLWTVFGGCRDPEGNVSPFFFPRCLSEHRDRLITISLELFRTRATMFYDT